MQAWMCTGATVSMLVVTVRLVVAATPTTTTTMTSATTTAATRAMCGAQTTVRVTPPVRTGAVIGQVQLEQLADNSVKITLTLKDANVVKPGQHGIHFHAVGKCDGPDFTTAGAHFNPTNKMHGTKNPQGPHLGDLPNLPIDASTAAQSGYAATLTTQMITLSAGPASIFDADGTLLAEYPWPAPGTKYVGSGNPRGPRGPRKNRGVSEMS